MGAVQRAMCADNLSTFILFLPVHIYKIGLRLLSNDNLRAGIAGTVWIHTAEHINEIASLNWMLIKSHLMIKK